MIRKECIKAEVNLLGDLFLIGLEEFDEKIKNLSTEERKIKNGGPGSGNHNPGQGQGIGKPSKSSILSKKMKSLSWSETQDLLRNDEVRQIVKKIGLKTYDDLWNMWAKAKDEDFSEKDTKEIDVDDALDVVRKNIKLSTLEGWFVNADSNYKPEIVTKILENKELRNAGLNIAYYNYKNSFESDISFSDFIKTPISLYRGEYGQTHVEQDWFDAYTPVKDIAEGFGDIVTEIKIKPIETLGAYFDYAESEYLVLTKTSMHNMNSMKDENLFITRINKLDKILNSINENLDYRYDVKAYKEYLKEWLKHKDEPEYLRNGVLSFAEFWEHDIDYEFEDYKTILKLIDEYNKKKELVINGGPGSGNFNPGQGRGVGKPSNKTGKFVKSSSPSLKMSENSKKFYEKLNPKIQESFEKCVSRLKKTNISLDNVELEFVNSNTSGGGNGWVNVVDGDNIDSRMIVNLIKPVLKKFTEKEQDVYKHASVADNSSEAIIDHEFGHVLMYKKAAEIGIKPKSAHLFAEMIVKNEAKKLNIDLNDESTENFSEYAHRNYTEFIAEAYSRPDYSKLTQNVSDSLCNNKYSKDDFKNFIMETIGVQTNENNSKIEGLNEILNGGPGSGNHNPGQGRGVGKPSNGHTSHSGTQYSAKNYLSKKEYENIVNYSSEDNFTEEELDAIAGYTRSMGYGASCDLNQAIRENDFGEIIERENVVFPEDDSQIVTWKENKEFIEQKIKDKKKYDSLNQEIQLAASVLRKGGLSDEKETEKLKAYVSEMQKERDNLSKTLKYSEYENYIKNYEKGLYKNIKDDQKMWTIDEDKLSKISVVKLREKQKSEQKRFDEVLEIPRLMWSMWNDDKPTTTDTLANKYQRDFKDLDKLDNIIKNKGFVLDKDITVTRRVANAKVIENQIKNKGEYTQNGITSVTAAKSIGKKMPSGVHMGDDLIRITIPKGTRVISTYNPFVRDTQKSADKYNGGKLSEEDNRNLRMIKGQNELILPSGSKFVSPGGNKLTQNEDGSYQLILQSREEKMKNRIERLNFLQEIFNGVNRGNPYHDKFGRFTSAGSTTSSSTLYYDSDTTLGDASKSGDITKDIKSFKDFKNRLDKVKENYNGYLIEGQEVWVSPESKLFKKTESPVTDENILKMRKEEIEKENKSPFVLVSTFKNKDVIVDGNHVAAAYRELSEEGKNYLVPILYVEKKELERFEKENPYYHDGEKQYTKTKLINEK